MTADRIKEIMDLTAYPNSISVYQALVQVGTEVQAECNEKVGACYKCEHFGDSEIMTICFDGNIDEPNEDDFCSKFKRRVL
jgi:hypothetical protein